MTDLTPEQAADCWAHRPGSPITIEKVLGLRPDLSEGEAQYIAEAVCHYLPRVRVSPWWMGCGGEAIKQGGK